MSELDDDGVAVTIPLNLLSTVASVTRTIRLDPRGTVCRWGGGVCASLRDD